jgi:hypothetical protein
MNVTRCALQLFDGVEAGERPRPSLLNATAAQHAEEHEDRSRAGDDAI